MSRGKKASSHDQVLGVQEFMRTRAREVKAAAKGKKKGAKIEGVLPPIHEPELTYVRGIRREFVEAVCPDDHDVAVLGARIEVPYPPGPLLDAVLKQVEQETPLDNPAETFEHAHARALSSLTDLMVCLLKTERPGRFSEAGRVAGLARQLGTATATRAEAFLGGAPNGQMGHALGQVGYVHGAVEHPIFGGGVDGVNGLGMDIGFGMGGNPNDGATLTREVMKALEKQSAGHADSSRANRASELDRLLIIVKQRGMKPAQRKGIQKRIDRLTAQIAGEADEPPAAPPAPAMPPMPRQLVDRPFGNVMAGGGGVGVRYVR